MQNKIKTLPWTLIVILGLIALVRPIVKTLGSFLGFEVAPLVTLTITAVIALLWISVVVVKKLHDPILVLAAVGAVYAVSSIFMAVIIQTIYPGSGSEEVSIPVLLSAGLIASTISNIIWGGFLGFIASLVLKLKKSR